jgi:phosphatidylethanolamine/phosphatidyl-N-methylethanolamine N-methyltransferase
MTAGDRLLFLRAWVRDPARVGAVAPSGRALANLITADLTPADLPVVELGPGTGAFTEALIARGVPESGLALVEADASFARSLRTRFPRARVLTMDAAQLGGVSALFDRPAGAAVSGLPLLSMPPATVAAIMRGVFHHMRPGGALYQFTYLPRCPVPPAVMTELGLHATRIGAAWANLPPGFVFRIRRSATTPS